MATRRPLVLISGGFSELPQGDNVAGASVTLLPNASGLFFAGSDLGIDGVAIASGEAAQATANAALASGNFALADASTASDEASTAQASGNAALALIASLPHLDEAEVISLIIGLS